MKRLLLPLCLVLSTMSMAQSTGFQDSLLDQFAGSWLMHGTIGGEQTTHDVLANWILGHEYLSFHEISHETDSTGAPLYEAIVTIGWDTATKQYACLWLDNTSGNGLGGTIGYARREPGRIAFIFKGSNGSIFHTTFIRNSKDDTWLWQMDDEENGKLEPFARVQLERN